MKKSLIACLAIACVAAGAVAMSATSYVVDRLAFYSHRFKTMAFDVGRWLLRGLPRVKAQWLAVWRDTRVTHDINPVSLREKRRPLLSPRWRMCPSV